MKRWESVTIIGVGLIGASIGLALRERRLAKKVVGVGRRASTLRQAKDCGAVTATTINLERGVADAELIVVCTPVELIVERVIEAAAQARPGTLITDAGST
jgi:prephenate dehydrogenase